jgi:hypothetical protein
MMMQMQKVYPSFKQQVPAAGFRWEKGGWPASDRGKPTWLLVPNESEDGGQRAPGFTPFEDVPALFKIFADLPPDDRGAILEFANQYGRLGVGTDSARPPSGDDPFPGVPGESLGNWADAIRSVRAAVEAWDAVVAGDADAAEATVRPHRGQLSRADGTAPPQDVFDEANLILERWVNGGLNRLGNSSEPGVIVRFWGGRSPAESGWKITPLSLLGAMWLQLGDAIAEGKEFRRCRMCDSWFFVPEGGRTARRVFCSDTCKAKDYRQRRDRAAELKAAGKGVGEIERTLSAEGLETDLDTIKKWVGTRGKK